MPPKKKRKPPRKRAPIKPRKSIATRKKPQKPKRKVKSKPVHIPVSSIHRESCEHTYKQYKEGKQLGRGASGTVHELCKDNKCPYVLKVQRGNVDLERFLREIEYQKKAHAFAPKIFDAWTCFHYDIVNVRHGFIVMERMDGSLTDYIVSHRPLEQSFVQTFMKILGSHVKRLHGLGIDHHDLKPDNIFFKGHKWYIGDFGLARPLNSFHSDTVRDDTETLQWIESILLREVKNAT